MCVNDGAGFTWLPPTRRDQHGSEINASPQNL
jgi:hypothetical protein